MHMGTVRKGLSAKPEWLEFSRREKFSPPLRSYSPAVRFCAERVMPMGFPTSRWSPLGCMARDVTCGRARPRKNFDDMRVQRIYTSFI